MQKNTLEMNEFTENESRIELNFRKFEETTHTKKNEKTHWNWL